MKNTGGTLMTTRNGISNVSRLCSHDTPVVDLHAAVTGSTLYNCSDNVEKNISGMTTTTTHPNDDNDDDRSILLRKRMILAVGGNPLQCRGERLTIENMMKAAADIAPTVAELCQRHEIVLTHGNGPQVGGLALEQSAATFDVMCWVVKVWDKAATCCHRCTIPSSPITDASSSTCCFNIRDMYRLL
jgi:hypothetical protein